MMTTPPTSDDPFGWINQLPAALERPIEFPKLEIDNFGGSFADEEMFDEYHRIISKAEQLVNSSEYKNAVDIVEQFLGSELLQTYQVFVDEVFGSPSYLYVIELKESIERVRILLGQLKEFSGDYAGAVRCFRHAYERDWHDDERWEMHTMLTIDVARAYLGDKQFAEAIEALECLLSDFKHNYPPEYSLEDRFYDAEQADFIFCVDAKARFLLGTTLLLAPDNLRDPIRALNLFSESAIYFPLGGLVAGKMYEIGLGSVRSAPKASEYFTIARKHGVVKFGGILITANEGLGEIDKPIDLPDNTAQLTQLSYVGLKLAQNTRTGLVEELETRIRGSQSDTEVPLGTLHLDLGYILFYGISNRKDTKKAIASYAKAYQCGQSGAITDIAKIFRAEANTSPSNIKESYKFLSVASALGLEDSNRQMLDVEKSLKSTDLESLDEEAEGIFSEVQELLSGTLAGKPNSQK